MKKVLNAITALLLVTTLLTGTSGCLTTTLIEKLEDPKAGTKIEFPVINDTIVAIGQPDKALLEHLGHPKTIAFLGEKHTYFLLEGGEDLVQMSKVLNGNFIHISPEAMRMTEDHAIVGYSENHRMFVKDNKVWGTITLSYHPDGGIPLSNQEVSLLQKLKFTKSKNKEDSEIYTKELNFKGVLGPRVDIPQSQTQLLKIKRSISFFAPDGSTIVPTIIGYLALPAAVVADAVITPPLIVIGIPLFILTFKGIN